jgi:flagellar biogenesis protein FliO
VSLHLATWLLLGRYTAAAPGATEFLGGALDAIERGGAAPRETSAVALFFGVLWKLALVVALIVLTIWLLRRFMSPGGFPLASAGPVRVLAVRHLDARHAVWLVEVGERILVVGSGGGALSLLADVESPVERAALRERARETAGAGAFGSYLAAWISRTSGGGETKRQLESGASFLSEELERLRGHRGGGTPPEGKA